jgi:Uma2 family endonuclease
MRTSDGFAKEPLHRLRISDVDALLEAGALDEARVELLDGRLVTMSSQGGPHLWTTQRLAMRLVAQLGAEHQVIQHSSFEIGPYSMPEPDVAVVPSPHDDERPTRALLVIEVSESTLGRDRRKAALYAAAKVPEYWIANLRADTVEVRTRPAAGRYRTLTVVERSARLVPVELPHVTIELADVMPRAALSSTASPRNTSGHAASRRVPKATSPARRARRR